MRSVCRLLNARMKITATTFTNQNDENRTVNASLSYNTVWHVKHTVYFLIYDACTRKNLNTMHCYTQNNFSVSYLPVCIVYFLPMFLALLFHLRFFFHRTYFKEYLLNTVLLFRQTILSIIVASFSTAYGATSRHISYKHH